MKKPPLPVLVKKLDRVFSKFIRLRDSRGGQARCITCGRWDRWENMDCGHFVKRQYRTTRWEPMNCHAQCTRCNLYLGGAQDEYAAAIIRMYGKERFERLMAMKHETAKYSRSDLELMIQSYQSGIENLHERA